MALTPDDPTKAQAWISGTPPDQTIDFYIPRGNIGPQGPRGPMGPSVAVGTVETNMGPAAPGTVGPQGLPGPKGDPGGFTAGTELGNVDLNTIMIPGLYRQVFHGNVTLANNYPLASSDGTGTLEVIQMGAAPENGAIQRYTPVWGNHNGRIAFIRTYAASAWTPWRALRTSRVDQSAGRAIYLWDEVNNREQLIYGDTGWRSILDMFPTRNYGRIEVRRIGSIVHLLMEAAAFTDSAPGLTKVFDLGSGWSSEATVLLPIDNAAEDSVLHRIKASWNGQHELKFRSGFGFQGMVSWVTKDPWPSTLPGTASGAIPNT